MAAVMWHAVEVDDRSSDRGQELITQLRTENESMRLLLQISTSSRGPLSLNPQTDDKVCVWTMIQTLFT